MSECSLIDKRGEMFLHHLRRRAYKNLAILKEKACLPQGRFTGVFSRLVSFTQSWYGGNQIAIELKKDVRLPPAYLPPTNFVEDAFLKDKSVFFFQKNYSIKFCNFTKTSLFAKKPSQSRWKRHFRKSFNLIRILQICHLYRFFKKSRFYQKNPTFL